MSADLTLPDGPVSRETKARLDLFCNMLIKWNKTINLVAGTTLEFLWDRHITDSAQLFKFCPIDAKTWVDVGSGGGFPGLVVAALIADRTVECRMTLIESDKRKAVFLREAARAMELQVDVMMARAESCPAQDAYVMSARALAPLPDLLALASRHLRPNGLAIFPKGISAGSEIADAHAAGWRFDLDRHTSVTDPAAEILTIRNIRLESKH